MKSFTLATIFFLFAFTCSFAQKTTRVTVQDNEDIQYALKDQLYRFPAFQNGKVFLPNGKYNSAKLNLNLLTNQIQFIDEKKDTLTILSPEQLHHVEIDGITFIYHENGFLEMIGDYFPVALARNQKLKIVDRQREGAYGTKSSSASIATVSTGYTDQLRYNPKVHEDLLVNKVETFYLVDDKTNVSEVSKRNLQRAFPAHKNKISEYIKENKIRFNKEQEVKALLEYIGKL
ncbi:hypothetical protein D770_09390 [Flammeovirgaceae bacterium 311]|nr:hypothetical protein D770_09390 [Flammeovirgaceae bacterium 311]